MDKHNDTIVAVASGSGGAIAIIRLSGPDAVAVCDQVFRAASGQKLDSAAGYTLHYGEIFDPKDSGRTVDDVMVALFRAPRSYTGEDSVEISCHGSRYIRQRIVELLLKHGARSAEAGEFTLRAFLNGKMDLSQAEAVADLIASADKAAYTVAANQIRGGYSAEFASLRSELLTLVSLLELELDFGEEDVEFADRSRLARLMEETRAKIAKLARSFSYGNVLKEGVAVAIAGNPNVGKSTLLNTLVNDDRVMVSDIAGTTRDVVEESMVIGGVRFRFLDTAGIRHTEDALEKMGIERTYTSIEKANIILLMAEAGATKEATLSNISEALAAIRIQPSQHLCIVVNKIDSGDAAAPSHEELAVALPSLQERRFGYVRISAKYGQNTDQLIEYLSSVADAQPFMDGETVVFNSRHYEALIRAQEAISRATDGLSMNAPTDLLAQDIRETLHHLGTITGEITTDEILGNIFSKFCIGK